MRIINRTKNWWRVPQDFMKVMNLTKSSWNSIWRSHHDHQPSQRFMKRYLTRFIKIMSCTKSSEKSIWKDSRGWSIARRILKAFMKEFVTIISRTESLWQRTYRGSSGLPTFFYSFIKRYEKPFSLSITSKEFLKWWAELYILWSWRCIRESYLNHSISPRIVEQLTDLSHYAKVIIQKTISKKTTKLKCSFLSVS
jgi:hypothetical protein